MPDTKKDMIVKDQVVQCSKIRPTVLISLEVCKTCDMYGGIESRPAALAGAPSQILVTCNLPRLVSVNNIVEPLGGQI